MTVRDMAKREKKRAIRCFADEYIRAHHMSPSMSEIAEAIGINKTTVWRYLKEIDEAGEVCYHGEDISTAVSVKVSAEQVSIPVAGVIPCGAPEDQVQDIEAFYSFPRALVGDGEFFIVRTILRRYSYTGNIVHGQRQAVAPCSRITRKVPESQQVISENVNPPIISKRQFQEAQKAIQSRDRRPVQTSHQHPLRGKLKCGNCNLSMQISETKGKRYAYCYHASMTGNTSRCYRDTYSLDDIENAVQAVLRVKLLTLTDLRDGLIQKNNKVIAQYEQEMRHLCGRMEAIKSERIRLYSSYAENCISKELYIQKRQILCEELEKCEGRTQTLKNRCDNMREVNSRVSSYTDLERTFTVNSLLTQHIVDTCIDAVYVYDPQHIEVQLLFEDILENCVSPTT